MRKSVRETAGLWCLLALLAFPFARGGAGQGSTARNPVLWQDLPDLDVIRVGDVYYYSASNMHFSPGAPILSSPDLLHWRYVGHSLPVLDFGPAYDLNGGQAYVKGSWASFFGYRKSSHSFLWGGCIGFAATYLYSAPAAEGPWTRLAKLPRCYYDAGLLIDRDDTMYVAYGNKTLSVAQLSADGTREVRSEVVFRTPADIGVLEGSRFYRVGESYYIFATRPANAEYVLRSTSGPFGPYELRPLLKGAQSPIAGGGVPHQGGIVQTAKGDWYYMAFTDAFPGGRVPVLAPLSWDRDGWPQLALEGNAWPAVATTSEAAGPAVAETGEDVFDAKELAPAWEWNHNPDNRHWSAGHGLVLETATLSPADDLYAARNTLTHRIPGPVSSATVLLDYSGMKDGDRAGLAMLRNRSAWIGVLRQGRRYVLAMRQNLAMDSQWNTASVGEIAATQPLRGNKIWLRVNADIRPEIPAGTPRLADFSYSLDGRVFQPLGPAVALDSSWKFFMGYRYGLFHYGTRSLGGKVVVRSVRIAAEPTG